MVKMAPALCALWLPVNQCWSVWMTGGSPDMSLWMPFRLDGKMLFPDRDALARAAASEHYSLDPDEFHDAQICAIKLWREV